MTHLSASHRHWLGVTENVLGHVATLITGFVMMVIGLGLGVTMIMLPVGLVVGLIGAVVFISGIFGHFGFDT